MIPAHWTGYINHSVTFRPEAAPEELQPMLWAAMKGLDAQRCHIIYKSHRALLAMNLIETILPDVDEDGKSFLRDLNNQLLAQLAVLNNEVRLVSQ